MSAVVAPVCQWFLGCVREATTSRPHPVLGAVPCCARCAAFVDECRKTEG